MTPKIILVTGATSGLGRHAALALAQRGHHVIATGRRRALLDSLRAEATGRLDTVVLDVTDDLSVAAAVADVDALTGGHGVDVLINNAGYGQAGAVLDIDDRRLRDQYETNVFGLLRVTRAFVPAMIERGAGRVINVSSVGGRVTFPLFGVYNSTKYAVESLSDALRAELAPLGLDVVLVEPGPINTGFNDTARASLDGVAGRWAPVYRDALPRLEAVEARATGPEPVTRAFVSAIEARRPRARYVAPGPLAVVVALLRSVPARWVDAVLSAALRLAQVRPVTA